MTYGHLQFLVNLLLLKLLVLECPHDGFGVREELRLYPFPLGLDDRDPLVNLLEHVKFGTLLEDGPVEDLKLSSLALD